MNFCSDKPARQGLPEITPSQRKVMGIINIYKLRRVKNGWQGPGSPKVTYRTARELCARKLAREFERHGHLALELTALGRMVLDPNRKPR